MKRQGNAKKLRKLNNHRAKNRIDRLIAPEELKSAIQLEKLLIQAHKAVQTKDQYTQEAKDKAFKEAKKKRKAQRAKRKANR